MMYHKKFVAVVKCNGKVLREDGDLVTLPFGSDYSLLLKNLSSQKASVEISIDGKDVLSSQSLLLEPNSETELMGFLNGSEVRNRFRFIQKTKAVQDYRGDKIDDGIIRIEYAFEKKVVKKTIIHDHHHHNHHNYYTPPLFRHQVIHTNDYDDIYYSHSGEPRATSGVTNAFMSHTLGVSEAGASNPVYDNSVTCDSLDDTPISSVPNLDEGITVEGSRIDQSFNYGSIGELESSEVIILRLRGYKSTGSKIHKPVTIKTRKTCKSCGKKSNARIKFCPECGTSLEV